MKTLTTIGVVAVAATLTMGGCKVEKTKEGEVTLPKYEKTQEGDVTLPKYDVKTADVDVGTTKTEVTVPTVDVNMPPDSNATPAPAAPNP